MNETLREQITQYDALVQTYHALDEQIDTLLEAHEGHSDNMSDASMAKYRELARERDTVFNQMWTLEQILFTD